MRELSAKELKLYEQSIQGTIPMRCTTYNRDPTLYQEHYEDSNVIH